MYKRQDTYRAFEAAIDSPVSVFVDALNTYDISAYEPFERVYTSLTAGSIFNPFLGFDAVSYTHLDVYKRQILHSGLTSSKWVAMAYSPEPMTASSSHALLKR